MATTRPQHGRIERTLFIYVTWNLSRSVVARRRRQDAQRRTTVGAMAGPRRRALGARVAEHAGGPCRGEALTHKMIWLGGGRSSVTKTEVSDTSGCGGVLTLSPM